MIEVRSTESFVRAATGGKECARCRKAPRAVPAENFNLVVAPAVCGSVKFAIGVEVCNNDGMRVWIRVGIDGRAGGEMEATVAITEQHTQVRRLVVRDDKV